MFETKISNHLLVSLQLRGGVVEENLLHLLLLLQVKERELLHQVIAHHLKVILGVCTLLAGLWGGGRVSVASWDKLRCFWDQWRVF